MVAGPGFEPGMLRAYETGVVAALPAKYYTTDNLHVAPRYCYHSPDYTSPDGSRYVTWDSSSTVSFTDLRSSPRVGVEPINLLLSSTFEEYCTA